MSVLVVEGMAAGYGDVDILSDIALRVDPLEIVTIAGTNGAGKSTLVKGLMGLLTRIRGKVEFEGTSLLGVAAERRIHLGISYVPQVNNVFPSLTVLENLEVVEGVGNRARQIAKMIERFPALAARRATRAGALSGGERQQLAFARALMPAPRLVILDEPTAALSPALVTGVLETIRGLPGLGVSVLLVEQRARQALAISDQGCILDSGKVVIADRASALLADERMAELYLGEH
ncbi:ABC transporter protein [Rhodospirillum rubrum F11]|uniref:ABC transporter component n=3 Tax=Rhodospirillum rubrum TaxID=1085 RepID=Q2RNT8_RHORT|nr:ATP-binding cassette domain-containing protein [Rhodospirillum rubrum]ABC24207.1 ABC transporter component [Rhodospirillum rubrum ATCC 11170]AEO49958.1 ABC transporter protein [Rhodospirillum rubrum F11]MBK5955925.1 ABC transporter ATP-binding protein [Rhodospirillum rubrum]QXG80142.1 ATP-binding cassette domain-containing protein [Rhodospirillum rubrum]